MVKLLDFQMFRYSMPDQPLWCGSIWYTLVTLDLLITLGASQVTQVNTKFRKSSKIGLWSYFGARFRYEGVVCQSGIKGR
jgi:hypothetical protein